MYIKYNTVTNVYVYLAWAVQSDENFARAKIKASSCELNTMCIVHACNAVCKPYS